MACSPTRRDDIDDMLGPRPGGGTARLRDEVAARIDKHHAAIDLADEGLILGLTPASQVTERHRH